MRKGIILGFIAGMSTVFYGLLTERIIVVNNMDGSVNIRNGKKTNK